ncbi:hypothetical protein PISMIDRAFT_674870 [Pisolithus microcarpus 441]|uniref:Uncharacterized protein n=1 Tax=Pisolithus microcarpus 441 TaxID=765257 RepID=A0A0D0A651_9AGAM|nr:hypothetical protein BKA83DRAFT_4228834 [Pisolithus microcarpus]KIK27503.1 hypothetical protein PISMIDRAFT_674870 [Pisolithus microcarpus 441]
MPNHAQLIHASDPAYAPPVIRPPSPASSVGTVYEPDQTSQSDAELSKEEFEQKWLAKLHLDDLKIEEEDNLRPVLIDPRPPPDSPEEKLLVQNILVGLRSRVRQLEEDAVFQQLTMRGSKVGLEKAPSTSNIDALMRNMMPTKINGPRISDGPWNRKREDFDITLSHGTATREK